MLIHWTPNPLEVGSLVLFSSWFKVVLTKCFLGFFIFGLFVYFLVDLVGGCDAMDDFDELLPLCVCVCV